MKIDPSKIDRKDFRVAAGLQVSYTPCILVTPHAFPKWDESNKIYRSSMWTEDGQPVSLGWRKFTNHGEQPGFEPLKTTGPLTYVQKIDGSAMYVSKFKGELVVRTRGAATAYQHLNADELDVLKAKYPKAFDNKFLDNEDCTFLYEWTSPKNIIVLKESDEPELWLLGITNHENYTYLTQSMVDAVARQLDLKRPEQHTYKNFKEALKDVEMWKGKEGIVVYGNNDQVLKKIKSELYCRLHALKSNLSQEGILELFLDMDRPSHPEFYASLLNMLQLDALDFETQQQTIGWISRVCDADKEVKAIVEGMKAFCEKIKYIPRKEAAEKIFASYGATNRADFVFMTLNGKTLERKQILKLFWQILKGV
jgi:hypothetical protein